MNALITGGSGLLGSELARWLISKGQRPVLMDIASPEKRLHGIPSEAFDFVSGSFIDHNLLGETIHTHGIDTLFHLGGMLSLPSEDDPEKAIGVNAVGTLDVLEDARSAGMQRVVFASSIAVYGLDLPEGAIGDRCLQRPTSIYGICKSFSEQIGLYFHRRYGLDFRGLRIPSVVAPGCRVAHMSIYNCWAIEEPLKGNPYRIPVDPSLRCPTIYYKDAVRALWELSVADGSTIKTRVYNLAGCRPFYSAGDLCDRVRRFLPEADLDFDVDERINTLLGGLAKIDLDDGNARQDWGWRPAFDLDAMIADFSKMIIDRAAVPK
ncbi:NAD-dependent epimerase [Desulfosarcina widdelii]|uniref:NAD-dependent epimerase n=1 Tax=Desulfosarcina widdelii TaxID=947919 RepID=A0A5K7Z8G8_9BACT|nr:NAD-dependent epimerase/dehydratase family protein [Desulfosarcina widdelii]BBO76985.1 NAD-dependent epimerase [Desulfosarcina widdelii]